MTASGLSLAGALEAEQGCLGQAFGGLAQDVVPFAESEADKWLPGLLVVAKSRQRDSSNTLEFWQTHAIVGAVVETERGDIGDDEVGAGRCRTL